MSYVFGLGFYKETVYEVIWYQLIEAEWRIYALVN